MSPTAGTPGAAELMRAVSDIRSDIRDLRVDLAKDYVRKEVQDERERRISDQITGLVVDVSNIETKISSLTAQRDNERDERDKQLAANRRWMISLLITALIGPVGVVVVLHALGLLAGPQ